MTDSSETLEIAEREEQEPAPIIEPALPEKKKRGRPAGTRKKVEIAVVPIEVLPSVSEPEVPSKAAEVEPVTPKRKPRRRMTVQQFEAVQETVVSHPDKEASLSAEEQRNLTIKAQLELRQAQYEARRAHFESLVHKMFV